MRILSWNVNGIRAIYKKGFVRWLADNAPDILCLQETKASEDTFPDEIRGMHEYHAYYSSAEKKGYSGVATLSREKPARVERGFGIEKFDSEGRAIIAYYGAFVLCNIYFPNGKASKERLRYKMDFYNAFLDFAESLKSRGRSIIVCGDVNTAHAEIDLARPKENEHVSGFLPEERAWIDAFVSRGYIDTFRLFNREGGNYTWWDYKTRARERNVGWRIDYFFVSGDLKGKVTDAFILSDVEGSDHCPIGIEFDL